LRVKPCVRFSVVLMFWAIFFSIKWIAVVGLCVLLHETAHMVACRLLKIPVYDIKTLPWGLTAFTPLMYDPISQFVVSVAGPMFNFFLLAFSGVIRNFAGNDVADLFVIANLADGLLNLIPALPLDGGIILKAFLCSKFGFVRGFNYMIKTTAAVGILIMAFGIQIFLLTGYNISYFVAGIFIIVNLRHEKYLMVCIKKRILTGEIRSISAVRQVKVSHDSNALCLVDYISPSYTLVFKVMDAGKEVGVVRQSDLIDAVLKNTMITVGECIEKKVNS